ncbi:MAG: hypothetical protein JNK08_00315 [Sediminibacterium sp.]|nr:hypothetical protein [Sediminibacterium sp.]
MNKEYDNDHTKLPNFGKGFWAIGNPQNDSEWVIVPDLDYSPNMKYEDYLKINPHLLVWRLNEKDCPTISKNESDNYSSPQCKDGR